MKPKYLQDYTVLACLAKFADEINEVQPMKPKQLNSDMNTENTQDEEIFPIGAVDYCTPQSFQELENRELWLSAI
jgi:hypothetical protein